MNHSFAFDQSALPPRRVFPRLCPIRHAAPAFSVIISWHPHPQSLVWPFIIVFPTPSPGPSLLPSHAGGRRMQSFCFVNPVHLFMRPILFGMSRLDELYANAQFDPPGA